MLSKGLNKKYEREKLENLHLFLIKKIALKVTGLLQIFLLFYQQQIFSKVSMNEIKFYFKITVRTNI